MKKSKLITILGSIAMLIVLITLPFMAACTSPTPGEPITLKAISFLGKTSAGADGFREYIKRVN
ncbi:hypothetical protein ACFLTP_04690, partial [Chloroflexota bacterium]